MRSREIQISSITATCHSSLLSYLGLDWSYLTSKQKHLHQRWWRCLNQMRTKHLSTCPLPWPSSRCLVLQESARRYHIQAFGLAEVTVINSCFYDHQVTSGCFWVVIMAYCTFFDNNIFSKGSAELHSRHGPKLKVHLTPLCRTAAHMNNLYVFDWQSLSVLGLYAVQCTIFDWSDPLSWKLFNPSLQGSSTHSSW